MNKNKTLKYYNKNADNFAKTTINVDFYETQNRFSALLPEHGYILDFGCGSGRDTKYFLEQGFSRILMNVMLTMGYGRAHQFFT